MEGSGIKPNSFYLIWRVLNKKIYKKRVQEKNLENILLVFETDLILKNKYMP